MARAFTSTFTYENKHYTAVITQIDGSVSIYVPDERLHGILLQGRFTFTTDIGVKIDTPALSPVQNLVLSILSAVEAQHEVEVSENSKGMGQ